MPEYWTHVILCSDAQETLSRFLQCECNESNSIDFMKHKPPDISTHTFCGFDGVVLNKEDAQMEFAPSRMIHGMKQNPSLHAFLETRNAPPFLFFKRMSLKYPLISIMMKVSTDDDEWRGLRCWFDVRLSETENSSILHWNTPWLESAPSRMRPASHCRKPSQSLIIDQDPALARLEPGQV